MTLDEYADKTCEPLRDLLQRAADHHGITATVAKEGTGENIILTLHGITIVPAHVPRPSIRGTIDINGWQVSDWKHVSNYPHEPDDLDEIIIGSNPSLGVIVRLTLSTIFNRKLDDWLENQSEMNHDDPLRTDSPSF